MHRKSPLTTTGCYRRPRDARTASSDSCRGVRAMLFLEGAAQLCDLLLIYATDVRPVLLFRQRYGTRFERGFAGRLTFLAAAWQVGNSSSSSGVAGKQHLAMVAPGSSCSERRCDSLCIQGWATLCRIRKQAPSGRGPCGTIDNTGASQIA